MTKILRFTGVVLGCAFVTALALAQNRVYTNQYSFGDSLTDNGNAYVASGGTVNSNPAYFGGRWSNGPTYAEQLGNTLAIGAAAPASVKTSMDFAFGGATAVPALSAVPFPALPAQIQMFQSHAVAIQRTDLFTVWMGANDILNTASQANPAAMAPAGINAAQATISGIQTLITLGAKNILVINMPDIGLTPAGLSSGGGSLLTAGSLAYNAEFDSRLRGLAASAPDVTLTRIDAAALIARIQVDYKALGFTNATSGLILPGSSGDPNGYVFFDGIHPTARTHALLARVVTEALNPEPVIGFAATEGTAALALESVAASAVETRLGQLAGSGRPIGRADAYASINYGDGNRAVDGWRPKFSYNAQDVTAGVDGRVSDSFTLGGALDTGRLVGSVTAGGGNFTLEDQSGKLYGEWRRGAVALAVDADYGITSVKSVHRTTAFGGFQTNGKTSGTHWGAGAKLTWVADVAGLSVRPWLGLRSERVSLGAYTERDVPSLTMAFAGQTAKSFAGTAGIDLGTDTKLAEHALHFDFNAAWHGEFSTGTRNVAGQLANNFTPLTAVNVTDGDGRGIQLGGAGTLFFAKNWSATLGVGADIRQHDKTGSRAALSVQTGF